MNKFKEQKVQNSTNISSAERRLQDLIKLKNELDAQEKEIKQKAFKLTVERENKRIKAVEMEINSSNDSRNILVKKLNNQSSLPDSSCSLM